MNIIIYDIYNKQTRYSLNEQLNRDYTETILHY
jgi:hypothetical protein